MLRAPLIAVALLVPCSGLAADPSFAGSWKTTFGVVEFERDGDALKGTFGPNGRYKITGTQADRVLKATYREDRAEGELTLTLDPSGNAFTGRFQLKGGRAGSWNGWRPDPSAKDDPRADFSGLWLTDLGLMKLAQDGDKVLGKYALRGGSTIEGTVSGRHLEFRYSAFGQGPGWFDLAKDGKALSGASGPEGPGGWSGWSGRRAPEYARHAPLQAGKLVDGSTAGLLTYTVRAPEGYKPDEDRKWPTILILHGSNMNGRAYVNTIASAWPDLARDYILLGINGELPSNTAAENPQFNYTYVNFTGKSTYQGFPGTDRESPALVASAMDELKGVYPVEHYFVGGHSQGGFLTYSLLMNSPERVAGAFPISCGLIMQCEPSAYADEPLRAAQRAVPLAIVHGRNDPVVGFGMGDYAAKRFGDASWPALRLFADDTAGHMFARLPVAQAIRWLEAMASDDAAKLVEFAEEGAKDGRWRDAIAAAKRARSLKPEGPSVDRLAKVASAIDAKAASEASKYADLIRTNADGSWIDGFLAFRDEFEFADASRDAMEAFAKLRAEHTKPAQTLMNEARGLFGQGKRNDGYAKYKEIADKYYAAPSYRDVKAALAARGAK